MAVAAFTHFRGDLYRTLSRCGSGKELMEWGYPRDIELASDYGISRSVPMLAGDRFIDADSAAVR
jgi:2-phosphosulfolactate phosphatase